MTAFLERPGALLAIDDAGGGGIPVVLTHGAGMDRSTFEDIASDLRTSGYRTITWDLRGHGESILSADHRFTAADARDDLAAIVRPLDRPILVGHSLGANLSQELVRRWPQLARGLVVLGATSNTGPLTPAEWFALRYLSAPSLALIPKRPLPGLLARASAVTPEAVARTRAIFTHMPKRTFLDVWRATVSLIDPDPAYRCAVPLALIRGEQDATGNVSASMAAWAVREQITERVIPRAGHVAMWDEPALTSLAVREAVTEVNRRG